MDMCFKKMVLNCRNDAIVSLPSKTLKRRVVCEKHFTRECFTNDLKVHLTASAVPTSQSINNQCGKSQVIKENEALRKNSLLVDNNPQSVKQCCFLFSSPTSSKPMKLKRISINLTKSSKKDYTRVKGELMESSTMNPDSCSSTSSSVPSDVEKNKIAQEPATSTSCSHEDKSVDVQALKAHESDHTTTKPTKEESTDSDKDKSSDIEQKPDKSDSTSTTINDKEVQGTKIESTDLKENKSSQKEQDHEKSDSSLTQPNKEDLLEMLIESTNSEEGKSSDIEQKPDKSTTKTLHKEELQGFMIGSINSKANESTEIEQELDKSDSTITLINEEKLLETLIESTNSEEGKSSDIKQKPDKSDSTINMQNEEIQELKIKSTNSKENESSEIVQDHDKSDSTITQPNEDKLLETLIESTNSEEGKPSDITQKPDKSDNTTNMLNEEEIHGISIALIDAKEANATGLEQDHDVSNSSLTQPNIEELKVMKVESTNTKEDRATNIEQEPDNKLVADLQPSTLDGKITASTKPDITGDLPHTNGTQITKTEPISSDLGKTTLSSKSSNEVGSEDDAKQKTKEQPVLHNLLNEKESSNIEVGITGSEENSNMSDTQETKSGFDSADSTNDVDAFITKNAVQIAIKLIDEEEENSTDNVHLPSSNVKLSLNIPVTTQHEDSTSKVETDFPPSSKVEGFEKLKKKILPNYDTKKVEVDVLSIESKMVVEEDCSSTNMDVVEESSLNLLENTKKLQEKGDIKSKSVECDKGKDSELEGLMKIQSVEHENLTKELVKKSKETVCSSKTASQEITVSKTTLLPKQSESILDEATPSIQTQSKQKTDNTDSNGSLRFCLSKNEPEESNKKDLLVNQENEKLSGPKLSASLLNLDQELQETSSEKENEKPVILDSDNEIMEIDEQISMKNESVIPNSQLSAISSFTHKNTNDNPVKDKNAASEISTVVFKNSEFGNNKYLESKKPNSVELDQPDDDDTSSSDLVAFMHSALAKNEEFSTFMSIDDNAVKEETINECGIELICLDDDDDKIQVKRPLEAKLCVNPNCMSGIDLQKPALFVLTYFKLKKAKNQLVCAECFNFVTEHQQKLAFMLEQRIPLYTASFPDNKDVVLLDSDEEEFSDNESNLSDDTMLLIQESLGEILPESMHTYNLDHQIRESCSYLSDNLDRLEDDVKEVSERFNAVQSTLDMVRRTIYADTEQPIRNVKELIVNDCEIPPMPVIKSKLQNMLYNQELSRHRKTQDQQLQKKLQEQQQKIQELLREREANNTWLKKAAVQRAIATKRVSNAPQTDDEPVSAQDVIAVTSEQRNQAPPDLPPAGVLQRPKLKVGELAFTMKVSYFSLWVLCRVLEVIPRNTTESDSSTETYRVKMENVKKNSIRTVTGKYLAYPEPAKVQLKVGTRVIAIFKEEEDGVPIKNNYYVGVIAEPPKSTNKYRYLVFFDDGYTQYCPHNNILVVCHTSKNVWEDIHPEPRDFIRNYLDQYPERPMVKMSRGQVVKVEWNGRWWIVRVLEVDGSLVKVHFDADRRTEWIYRGSTRLGPMYQELAAAKERHTGQSGSLLRTRGFGSSHKSDMPYVEYTRGDLDEKKDEDKDGESVVPVRSVARKSTAKKPPEPIIANIPYSKPLINHVPQGTVKQRELKPLHSPAPFRQHFCTPGCVARTNYSPALAKSYDPLMKPLMFGFSRLAMSYKGKTVILYRGPCGRMLRTYADVLLFLQMAKSALTIDLFDFDFWVNPLHEFEGAKTFCRIEDLSYGKENVPISCVNELDHSMPPYVTYMTDRRPANDVNLNLDPEFLTGCDCTDDCEDREKCSCWKLTMQGKAYTPNGDLDPLFGYQYRRLPERIATGIYECNSKCKCRATCQNRVAQQPLSCQLQLFKTVMKGWGIRCLHDIPKGAFICIYAGFLLTEQEANEGGKTYGDEYLAELDYIESVEGLKEGYEQEAREMTDDEENEGGSERMDMEYKDNDDNSQSMDSDNDYEASLSTKNREDIRLRLRKRLTDDSDKESKKSAGNEEEPISISDEEVEPGQTDSSSNCSREAGQHLTIARRPQTFNANITILDNPEEKHPSVREMYGKDENVYIMDAKTNGNIGRYLNHSCSPNVFVQNVFVDTHDLRFPWVAFFASQYIAAGTELTWDYNYDVGSVPGKVMHCYCNNPNCRGRLL